MSNVRRAYIYLISAISLQAVIWAIISLVRSFILAPLNPSIAVVAFQLAVILIGLPVFLGHWIWAQRLVAADIEERGAPLRRLYLYGMMVGFQVPFAANAFDLIGTLLQVDTTLDRRPSGLDTGQAIIYHLVALLILALFWWYHRRETTSDARIVPEIRNAALVRRFYVLGFSAAGVVMIVMGIIQLVRWIITFDAMAIGSIALEVGMTREVTRLIIGLGLWLPFWRWAQVLFWYTTSEEAQSALRKFYLYTAIWFGALGTVASLTGILAGVFRRLLSLPPEGDLTTPLSLIIGLGLLWAYHAVVLQGDTRRTSEAPQQAGVRRLYHYLVAAIGLLALLIGLAGDVSVLLRSFEGGFGDSLREEVAWFTAAIIAGLPVWLWSWWQMQRQTLDLNAKGKAARRSLSRKIYLYFYMLISTLTALSAFIFILAQFLTWLLGDDIPIFTDMAHAAAFSLIALGVWLYHGWELRNDSRSEGQAENQQLTAMRLVILDFVGNHWGQTVAEALKRDVPGLNLTPTYLGRLDEQTDDTIQLPSIQAVIEQVTQADVIVSPWQVAVSGVSDAAYQVPANLVQAVINSPARKLLIPKPATGWDWVGLETLAVDALAQQTVQAIKQIAAGEAVKPAHPMGIGMIIAIIGSILLLLMIGIPLIGFIFF